MAVADVTYHSTKGLDVPVWGGGGLGIAPVLPPQVGNSQQLNFATVVNGAVQADAVLAVIIPDANCRVVSGLSASATLANSRRCNAEIPEYVYVAAGHRLSFMAA